MFTEIRGKIYLNEMSMTMLMADLLKEYVQVQTPEGLAELDAHAQDDTPFIVDAFKKKWRRPQDGSNSILHALYRSVPDALQQAARLETNHRQETLMAERHRQFLEALTNPQYLNDDDWQPVYDIDDDEWPDDDEWHHIHNEEDL